MVELAEEAPDLDLRRMAGRQIELRRCIGVFRPPAVACHPNQSGWPLRPQVLLGSCPPAFGCTWLLMPAPCRLQWRPPTPAYKFFHLPDIGLQELLAKVVQRNRSTPGRLTRTAAPASCPRKARAKPALLCWAGGWRSIQLKCRSKR